jgi:hypothetical protein
MAYIKVRDEVDLSLETLLSNTCLSPEWSDERLINFSGCREILGEELCKKVISMVVVRCLDPFSEKYRATELSQKHNAMRFVRAYQHYLPKHWLATIENHEPVRPEIDERGFGIYLDYGERYSSRELLHAIDMHKYFGDLIKEKKLEYNNNMYKCLVGLRDLRTVPVDVLKEVIDYSGCNIKERNINN